MKIEKCVPGPGCAVNQIQVWHHEIEGEDISKGCPAPHLEIRTVDNRIFKFTVEIYIFAAAPPGSRLRLVANFQLARVLRTILWCNHSTSHMNAHERQRVAPGRA